MLKLLFFININFEIKASSPDELALLNFAKFIGCEFIDLNESN